MNEFLNQLVHQNFHSSTNVKPQSGWTWVKRAYTGGEFGACPRVPESFSFLIFLRWKVTILWSHWYSLFLTLVDSAHGFQSQGGSIITHTLLWLVHNDPQSQLWIFRPGPGPNFATWYGEATARVTTQCHFWNCPRQIWTQDLWAQSLTLYQLSYPGRHESLGF